MASFGLNYRRQLCSNDFTLGYKAFAPLSLDVELIHYVFPLMTHIAKGWHFKLMRVIYSYVEQIRLGTNEE